MTTWFPELKNSALTLANCFRNGGSQVHKFGQIQNPRLSSSYAMLHAPCTIRSLSVANTHTDTDTRLSPIHPAYRSLAVPMRMFGSRSRNRKLFGLLSMVLAIK